MPGPAFVGMEWWGPTVAKAMTVLTQTGDDGELRQIAGTEKLFMVTDTVESRNLLHEQGVHALTRREYTRKVRDRYIEQGRLRVRFDTESALVGRRGNRVVKHTVKPTFKATPTRVS